MRNINRRGGAAVVAVLIVIMLVAVGSALMVVTGKNSIQANKDIQSPMPEGYDEQESEPDSSSESESEADDSSEVISEVTSPSMLPQIANTYVSIDTEDLTCKSAVLLDSQTNEILAGYKYDEQIYPASLTKLLTLLVAVENISDLDATYTFTSDDIDPLIEENASRAGFEAGEEVTMEDLLYASILVSGADGTVGLANSVAGSEEAFVELMNAKITELGISNTVFTNSSGLHSDEHYSTAQDIAVITKACLDNPDCEKILSASTYTTSETEQHEDGIVLNSIFHSRYTGYWVDLDGDGDGDADIVGGKTGFTDEAKYTLSTIIEYEDNYYICVTTGSDNEFTSIEDTIAVFESYLLDAISGESADTADEADESSADDTDTSSEAA